MRWGAETEVAGYIFLASGTTVLPRPLRLAAVPATRYRFLCGKFMTAASERTRYSVSIGVWPLCLAADFQPLTLIGSPQHRTPVKTKKKINFCRLFDTVLGLP
jgi:hypothetical protein